MAGRNAAYVSRYLTRKFEENSKRATTGCNHLMVSLVHASPSRLTKVPISSIGRGVDTKADGKI
jgi:hypothetical protein